MSPDRQRLSTRTHELREEDLTAVVPPRAGRERPPEIAIPGDGRLILNTAATFLLSPDTPLAGIRLYLAEKGKDRFLVVRPATKDATDAIKIFPTGKYYQDHWPAIVMGRAASTLRKIGIVERCRLEGLHDPQNNWLIFNLNQAKPYQDIEGGDPMGEALALWLKVAKRKRTVLLKDALEEVREVWEKEAARPGSRPRGPFPFTRPIVVGAYLRKHAAEYGRQGLRLSGSGMKPPITLQ